MSLINELNGHIVVFSYKVHNLKAIKKFINHIKTIIMTIVKNKSIFVNNLFDELFNSVQNLKIGAS